MFCFEGIEAKNPYVEPAKPGTPDITDYDTDFVELAWKRPDSDGGSPITGYVIEKKDKYSAGWEPCLTVDGDTPNARVPDLIEGLQYEFRVRAINKGGASEPSDATHPHVARPKNMAPKIDRTNMIEVLFTFLPLFIILHHSLSPYYLIYLHFTIYHRLL